MKKSKSNREEKMSEIQERLMNGTKEIYESGKWAEYISVCEALRIQKLLKRGL